MPYDPNRHGPSRIVGLGVHERVFAVVKRVPSGFVTTYGDVAEALGLRRAARQVGFALAALPENRRDVPWHRVVDRCGRLAPAAIDEQRRRLAAEGHRFDASSRVADFAASRLPLPALVADR